MIEWGQVTWYSKLGAIILFVGIVPVLTFYIGMQYQQVTMPIQNVSISTSQKILTPHLNILAGRLSETEGTAKLMAKYWFHFFKHIFSKKKAA